MEKIKPFLAIYNANQQALIDHVNQDLFNTFLFDYKTLNQQLFDEIERNFKDNVPIIFINAKATFPEYWFERLSQPFKQNKKTNISSALTCHVNHLSPLANGDVFEGSLNELDQTLYLLQKPGTFFSDKRNPDCFMVKDKKVLKNLETTPITACNNLLVQTHNKNIQLTDIIDTGDQRPLPAHPLSSLQWQLKKHLSSKPVSLGYILLDKKPVVLHICMGWGGGVSKWINDYCIHENKYQHLVLSSQGELYRQSHGEALTLHYANTEGLQIRNHELQTPIDATCLQHDEYQNILTEVLEQFQVQQIMVSSLIGHSMQCLQTDVPTVRILHDYFPSWPSLIADLEAEPLTEQQLQKALKQTKDEPFGLISEAQYKKWSNHLHDLYQNKNIKLVAPSQSVVDNLKKIDPNGFNHVSIIPHAIAPLKPLTYQNSITAFQVLILGRVNPPKGQQLLEDIISELGESYVFMMIGAGNEGKKYFKIKNIGVEMEYNNEDLQKLLEETSPSVALITSQTSETFNYTLSELQQAGICTISTKFGALKDRIIDGETGFLCDSDYLTIANKIQELRNNPEKIQKVRKNLRKIQHPTFTDEINQYQTLINLDNQSQYKLLSTNQDINLWAKHLHRFDKVNRHLGELLDETQNTLDERTQWGQELTKQLEKSVINIDLEQKESQRLKWALEQETNRLNSEILELHEAYEKNQKRVEAEKQELISELTGVYNSRSWRLTKPLRLFTTWARHKRNALKFRLTQLKTFPARAIRSLKTRGIKGTVSVIKGKVSKPQNTQNNTPKMELTQNFKPIKIKTTTHPIVSIIIPVYNHYEHTYNCLKSIAELNDKTSFEIIVVDDCSTDKTQELIQDISGITYKRQTQNGGFIESCNTGAKLSSGRYLMFLNNDTVVHDNWLDALVDIFNNHSDVGLVGSKLIYPNNQLQEAGGIIFSDASGWNYGRTEEPGKPEFNHVREADYCSGASILIKKKLFEKLGCFDQRYKPAYYEDTDLAFAVRQSGKKVYYQPASVITHFEGISSGTDLTQGMKKYQVVNQDKFKHKWAKQLTKQPKAGTHIELCRTHAQPKRILVFDACTPMPDQDAGSLRMINILKIFKELNYHVVFMPENLSHCDNYTESLQQLGIECIYTPYITNPVDYLKEKGSFLDAVVLSRYYVAEPILPFIRDYCPKAQLIFDTVDLHYLRESRLAALSDDAKLIKLANATKKKELAIANACDTTLVVSPYEVEVLAKEIPEKQVSVLSTIHEVYGCRNPFKNRKDLMFIGGFQHSPNVDAVEWFINDIFPLVVKKIPEIKFHIIGSKTPKQIKAFASDNIIVHGFVKDIEPFLDEVKIAVAPIRYGAGVKGKINTSMSYGQPVVGTQIAVEGMFTQEGVDVLSADTPQNFADQITRLYSDESLWNTLSVGGLKNVHNYFSFDAAKKAIKTILE